MDGIGREISLRLIKKGIGCELQNMPCAMFVKNHRTKHVVSAQLYSIVDRLKELIKYKGFQVPPADLEAVLLTHPKVGDVGVVGVMDHEQATEVPRAYVVPSGGLESLKNDEERKKFCKEVVDWTAKTVSVVRAECARYGSLKLWVCRE